MPPPDQAALAVFVQDFAEATGLGVTSEPFCFGDSPQLAEVDRGGLRLGALTFRPTPGSSDGVETEVVTVDALESGRGVGSLLLDAAATLARRTG
jgi:GNAT superfamily N-acetyltransferase